MCWCWRKSYSLRLNTGHRSHFAAVLFSLFRCRNTWKAGQGGTPRRRWWRQPTRDVRSGRQPPGLTAGRLQDPGRAICRARRHSIACKGLPAHAGPAAPLLLFQCASCCVCFSPVYATTEPPLFLHEVPCFACLEGWKRNAAAHMEMGAANAVTRLVEMAAAVLESEIH